jgi:hypothetical protein
MQEVIFLKGMKIIEDVYEEKFKEKRLDAYRTLLSDIPESLFVDGINKMLRERVYPGIPTPADIRNYCIGSIEEGIELKIALAVGNIRKAVTKYGGYKTVAFDDPIIHRIIKDYGTWYEFCTLSQEALENFLKFEVPKAYKIYAKNRIANIPLFLTGRFKEDEITYVGDKSQAKKWQIAYCEKTGEMLPNNLKVIEYTE